MQYSFTLKDNNQRAYRLFTWFLFFLHTAAAMFALNTTDNRVRLTIGILLGFYFIISIVYWFYRKHTSALEIFSLVMALFYANFWFQQVGIEARVQSAITIASVAEPFIRRRTLRHMEKGRMVVLAAGTGNPFFSTDTAAVLRALEIEADVLVKATKVDGVYDSDPKKNPNARRYDKLTYTKAIQDRLKVMDQTAFTMADEHKMPLIVLDFHKPGSLLDALTGGKSGTLVGDDNE